MMPNPLQAQFLDLSITKTLHTAMPETEKLIKFKLSFIVIPLHVGTYSGTKCRASQDHGAT